ncbi:hypothetical protein KBK19_11750 [Microvirga sp. STR05]|uniref:Glycosyltransferase RgtA/B/C/D-like domain-containing protein n=1 Tax=Hymenobacter duratus TaxID=2771356 RepID=A0ABR8JLP4_9BACT|nr:hypothetical protein [Hymenobacter duratus]MBD2715709.1 hypothetical protein [Hymenobacter duratus]MBR7950620.1 hypothetical protein [Microvirga sp. STR05]
MDLKDLLLTPLYLGLIYALAFAVRPQVTNLYTRKYFIPALSLKLVGAIALGLIYQFYYSGGDTFNYFIHSSVMYDAFGDSFAVGMKLLTSDGERLPELAKYTSRMFWWEPGSTELVIVRIATVLGMLCFNTYTVVGLFFACISFSGMWAMYMTFAKIRPQVYKQLAIAVFFIPSVFFWGSGLMKDSLCLGALGWIFYAFYQGAIQKKRLLKSLLIGGLAAYMLYITKVYILLSFLPPALIWVFNENSQRIKNKLVRMIAKPFLIGIGAVAAVFAMGNLTEGDEKYDIDKIGERSKITADYLYEVSVKQEGSAYTLGEQDGTIGGMIKLAPQAIIVALFRPFLWEAKNPVMLLSALEATFFLVFTLRILFRVGVARFFGAIAGTPVLMLSFIFALVFGASVGIISNNFGTLVRYKIPLIPFYVAALYILQDVSGAGKPSKGRTIARRRLATT